MKIFSHQETNLGFYRASTVVDLILYFEKIRSEEM